MNFNSLIILTFLFHAMLPFQLAAENKDPINYKSAEPDDIIRQRNMTFSPEYKNHSEILDIIITCRNLMRAGNTEEAYKKLQDALQLSKERQFEYGISDINLLLGEINYNWGRYDRALKFFLEARKLSSRLNYPSTEAAAFNYIGKYYHTTGNFQRSLTFFKKGVEIALNTPDSAIISELYRNIGNYYNTTGNHSHSLQYLYKSMEYLDEKKDPLNYASSCNHIGNVYQDQGNLIKALDYHKKALDLRKSMDDQDEIGKSLKNVGEVFEDMGSPDSAAVLYEEAHHIFLETGYRKGSIKIYNNLGRIYVGRNQIENGLDYLRNALTLSIESRYSKGIVNAHLELGNCHLKLKDNHTALDHYRQAIHEAKDHGLVELEREINLKFYNYYISENNYEKALDFHLEYTRLNDSIKKLEHLANIEELAVRYETRAKEQENNFLKKQNEIQQTSIQRKNLVIMISIAAILSLLIAIYSIFRNLRNKKRDNQELKSLNNRLKKLNSDLNVSNAERDKLYSVFVHELRNPLLWFRNITRTLKKNYDRMEKSNIKKALESLDESATHSYHLMDNLLQWTRSQLGKIELKPEDFDLDEIIKENIHFVNTTLEFRNISIEYRGEKNVVKSDKMMITTVIRNLISNAVKFTPEGGQIFISNELRNSKIFVSVRDTGVGINMKDQRKIFNPLHKFSRSGIMNEKGSGIGLLLCKEFVEKNGGELSFTSVEGIGTEFVFHLPAIEKNLNMHKKQTPAAF